MSVVVTPRWAGLTRAWRGIASRSRSIQILRAVIEGSVTIIGPPKGNSTRRFDGFGRVCRSIREIPKTALISAGFSWISAISIAPNTGLERSIELAPESFFPNLAMQDLHLYRGDLSTALEYGRRAFDTEHYRAYQFSSAEPVLIHEMRAGRYLEARAAFEKIAPELLNEDSPKIGSRNYRAAIDLALISSKTGEQQRADWLLESSLQYIQQIPRISGFGYGIADVQIYALQGEKQKALSALRQAIDEGWRSFWWYYLKYDPTLESLHDEPEFQAMIAEIEADMAAQLARVREMERNGELEPIPELAAE